MKFIKKKRFFIIAIAIVASVLVFVKVGAGQDNIIFDDSACKYETTILDKPTDGTTPSDHDPYDNIAYLMGSLMNKKSFETTTEGISDASLTKIKVYGKRVVKDGKAISSSVSDGMVSSGKQKYFLDNKVLLRDAKSIDGFETTWKEDGLECITNKVYLNRYGWLPFQVTGYIVCKETIIEEPVLVKNSDNTYSVTIKLNPGQDYAPFWYCREIVTNSNSSMMPVFYNIEITYTFTEDWDILVSDVYEEYKVKAMGIEAVSKTNCKETFSYDNVEFNKADLDYFKAHEDMEPVGNDEDTPSSRPLADAVTMIVESLQNEDKSDKNLSLELSINDSKLNGIFSINLSDLNNVVVKAMIDKIYIEYSDEIYVNYGSFSGKLGVDDLGKIIDQILNGLIGNPNDTQVNLDLQKILADINSTEIKLDDNGNIITIDPVINIMDIDINMHFVLTHVDNIYRIIFAEANCEINNTTISAYLTETTETVKEMDKSNLVDLSNIDFIIDDLVDIVNTKKLKITGTLSYEDLVVDVNLLIDLNKNLELAIDLDIKYQDISQQLKLKFVDRIIYLEYKNIKLKASFVELQSIIQRYFHEKLPFDLNKINLQNILTIILGLDFESLIKDLNIEKNNFEIALDLKTICEELKTLQVKIKQGTNLEIEALYDKLKANFDLTTFTEEIKVNDSEYQKLIFLNFIIDGVLGIVDSKKLTAMVNLGYENLLIECFTRVDFRDGLKLSLDTNIIYEDINMHLIITYLNDYVYLTYENLNLKISLDNLKIFLNKYLNIDLNFNTPNIDVVEIVKTLLSLDLEQIIKDLNVEKNKVDLVLDLSKLAKDLKDLVLTIEKGTNLNISAIYDKLNLSIKLNRLYDDIKVNDTLYDDLSYLDFILDNIIGLVNDKKLSSRVNLNYQGLNIDGLVNMDFTDKVKLYLDLNINYEKISEHFTLRYINDIIYLDYGNIKLKISYNDLDKFLNKYFNIDLNNIINNNSNIKINIKDLTKELLKLDVDKLIKELHLEEGKVQVLLDLKVILNNLKELQLEIRNGLGLEIDAIYDELSVSLKLSKLDSEITVEDLKYQDIANIEFLVDKVINLINNKKTELEFNFTLEEITFSGKGYFDLVNGLNLRLLLNIKSDKHCLNEDLIINYLNDFIYLDYNNLHLKLSLSDLNKILSYFDIKLDINQDITSGFDLNKLLNELINIDLKEVIKKISLIENELNLSLDLSCFIKTFDNINVIIKNSLKGFDVKLNLWDLELKVIENTDFLIEVVDETYTNLNKYIDPILDMLDLINKKSINLNIQDGEVLLKVNGKELKLIVDMNMDLILVNAKYELLGSFNVSMDNVYILIDFYLDSNNNLYLNLLNQTVVIDLNTENLNDFTKALMDKVNELNTGNPVKTIENKELNLNTNNKAILDILNNIIITEDNININLDYLFNEIFNISIALIKLQGTHDNYFDINVNYGSIVNVDAMLRVKESFIYESDFLNKYKVNVTTKDILSLVSSVVDTCNMNEFYFTLGTGININGQDIATINGNIMFRINSRNKDSLSFDLDIELFIQEYNLDGTPYQYHHVKLTVLSKESLTSNDGMVYGMYGNGDKTNKPSDYIRVRSTLSGMEKLANSLFSLVNNFNIEQVLNGLFETIKNMVNPDHEDFNLNNILKPIEFGSNLVNIIIPASLFNKKITNKDITISLINYNGKIEDIILDGIYLDYQDSLVYEKLAKTTINIYHPKTNDDLNYSDKVLIKEPANVNDYKFDLSNLHYLAESLKNTALQKAFNIKGNIELSVLSLIKINLGIDVRVVIDNNNKTKAHIHLDVPYIFAMLSKKSVDIYYDNDLIYINRIDDSGEQYKIKMHYSTFTEDIIYWLLKYAIAIPDSIYNKITGSTTENSPFVDAASCVTKVNILENSYTFGFDLRVITGNSNLGIIELTLNSKNVPTTINGKLESIPMLSSITNFSLGLVSDVVKINSSSLNLVNFTNDGVNKVDMSKANKYLENTINDEVDMYYEFKDNSWKAVKKIDHSIIFDLGYLDNLESRYTEGDLIKLPTIDNIISHTDNDGLHYYKFGGWFMDDMFQIPFNIEVMPSHSMRVYAKWIDITRTVVIESSAFNDTIVHITYEGSKLEDIFNLLKPVTAGNEVYGLTGFLKDGTLFTNELITDNITLTPVWEKVIYKANIDNTLIDLDFNSDKPLIESGKYMINLDGIYYLIDYSNLTSNNLYTYFLNAFNEDFIIDIKSVNDIEGYNKVLFNVDSKFNDKLYYGLMVSTNTNISRDLIPNKTYLDYEINAWIINNTYVNSENINLTVDQDYELNAYITVKKEYFKYKLNSIIGVNDSYKVEFDKLSTLILPVFNLDGEIIKKIGATPDTNNYYHGAFEGCTFSKVIISEGMEEIETNSFKNCTNLKDVYLPTTLKIVDRWAFYYDFAKYGQIRPIIERMRFYSKNDNVIRNANIISVLDWKNKEYIYGNKYGSFNPADLRNAFQTNDNDLLIIVNNIISAL